MRSVRTLVFVAALAFGFATSAHALRIVSHAEHYDAASDAFQFTFVLNGVPDLFTADSFGRPKDEFQYWITWDESLPHPYWPYVEADVIVRGGEIRLWGAIPIRNRLGGGSPGSGGWGPMRGMVPYVLDGPAISFTVPREMLGDSNGAFGYYFGVLEYGGMTDTRAGISDQADPDPDPVPVERSSWGRLKSLYR